MASEAERGGGFLVAGEDVPVCQSCVSSGATLSSITSALEDADSVYSQSVSDVPESTPCAADTLRVSVSDLPDEILIKIFSHMSFSELIDVVQKVCSRWRRLSQDFELWHDKEYHVRYWTCFDMDTSKGGTTDEEVIKTFCDAPNLRTVCMWRSARSRVFRALYSKCQRLSELQLHVSQKLSYSVLKNLVEKCARIRTLRISDELLKSEKFSEAVSHLQHLQVLSLDVHFTESTPALRPLGDGCPQLAEIDFGYTTVDMDDLRYFLNVKRNTLKSIHIKWAMDGKRCVLPLLAVCADSLERLQFYEFELVDDEAREAFTALGNLRNLQELKMMILDPLPPGTGALVFK
ncbi:putative F-box/LRR-repeat protein 9 [Schistocerca americana]|uniref:putative F-box/LRR-repeat protein 9 n=1 Tax=Schistocerca americana TaxID=7009 RepID=UPI001F4F3080|nr:putative F-box/LRR-repeat protein 9 [Schistocerca americana]